MLHRVPPHVIHEMANLKYFLSADISLAAVVSTQYLCSFLHCFCPVARLACCNQGEQKAHAPFIIATCWADFHLLTCHSLGIRGSEGSYFAKQSTVALYGEVWWRLTNCSFSILASSLLHIASKRCSHFILAPFFELAVSRGCDENQITCWGEKHGLQFSFGYANEAKKKRLLQWLLILPRCSSCVHHIACRIVGHAEMSHEWWALRLNLPGSLCQKFEALHKSNRTCWEMCGTVQDNKVRRALTATICDAPKQQ